MNLLTILSAVLFGVIHPVAIPDLDGCKEAYALLSDEVVVVALAPHCVSSHEERLALLNECAEGLSEKTGKEVLLTDDLQTLLCFKRMHRRGVSEYERKVLASRLLALKDEMIRATPSRSIGTA